MSKEAPVVEPIDANSNEWRDPGNQENVFTNMESAVARPASCEAEAHRVNWRAIDLAQAGRLAEAIEEFRVALRLDETRSPTHFNLGVALSQSGLTSESIQHLRQAVLLDSKYVEAQRCLARVLRVAGRLPESLEAFKEVLGLVPADVQMMREWADTLCEAGNAADAVIVLKQAACIESSCEVLNHLGEMQLVVGSAIDAEATFEKVLRLKPDNVESHLGLALAYKRQNHTEQAIAAYDLAVAYHRAKPVHWKPRQSREVAELALAAERRANNAIKCEDGACAMPHESNKVLTVLLGCYGDFSNYSTRAMDSIAAGDELKIHCDFLIGLNECCAETVSRARALLGEGVADGLVEFNHNRNKDPVMRLLIEAARTPYVLWLDDDSYFTDKNWPQALIAAIKREHPFDVAGQRARWGPRRDLDEQYTRFVRARPWFRTIEHQSAELREWIPFVPGGLFVARGEFLRRYDFPDRQMMKAMDDVALGELVQQVGGRLIGLPASVLEMARINDGHRRGRNFELPELTETNALPERRL